MAVESVELTRADAASVTSLLQLALEKDVDVTLLERLVALKERVDERDARKAYFDALAEFKKLCPKIPHDKVASIVGRNGGAGFSYSYASLDRIATHIAPHLEYCRLSYTWDTEFDGKIFKVICKTRHLDGHGETSSFPVPIGGSERMSAAQANGAALTYGKRQTLIAAFGLTTADTDVDGITGEGKSSDKITKEQAAALSDLIESVSANKAKFLKFMKVESLADIPASEYKNAVAALEEKRRAGI